MFTVFRLIYIQYIETHRVAVTSCFVLRSTLWHVTIGIVSPSLFPGLSSSPISFFQTRPRQLSRLPRAARCSMAHRQCPSQRRAPRLPACRCGENDVYDKSSPEDPEPCNHVCSPFLPLQFTDIIVNLYVPCRAMTPYVMVWARI